MRDELGSEQPPRHWSWQHWLSLVQARCLHEDGHTVEREKAYIQRNCFKGKTDASHSQRHTVFSYSGGEWLSTKKTNAGYHTYPFISIGKNKEKYKNIFGFFLK